MGHPVLKKRIIELYNSFLCLHLAKKRMALIKKGVSMSDNSVDTCSCYAAMVTVKSVRMDLMMFDAHSIENDSGIGRICSLYVMDVRVKLRY